MPSSRDSFRRNRVAPSLKIIPPGAGTGCVLGGAGESGRVNSRQLTAQRKKWRVLEGTPEVTGLNHRDAEPLELAER